MEGTGELCVGHVRLGVLFDLLSYCQGLAGPLWGSSWAETGRVLREYDVIMFWGRIELRGKEVVMRMSKNQVTAGVVSRK